MTNTPFKRLCAELLKLKPIVDRPPADLSGFRLNVEAKLLVGSYKNTFNFTFQEVKDIVFDVNVYLASGMAGNNIKKFTSKIGMIESVVFTVKNFSAEVQTLHYTGSLILTAAKFTCNSTELKAMIQEIKKL